KVAHHGSGDSTSPRFLELVNPELAVISVGRRNRHGHPDLNLLKELKSAGVRLWRTDLSGALVIRPRH
ncbi:ComEC/Rec2 family competence protein, partial [Gemmatimonadota bacterium]